MTALVPVDAGGFDYLPGVFQYSGGVVAQPGYVIERVRFMNPVPLDAGFARIEAFLTGQKRPLTAFCACELRSPAPFTEQGFTDFNRRYAGTLQRWGVMEEEANPVARSNVCPELHKPAEPSFHAFCFTRPRPGHTNSFVVAGSGESMEGSGSYAERTIRLGDTTPSGMKEKAAFVMARMDERMALLGMTWADTTAAQAYTVFDLHPFMADTIVAHGGARHGLTWHWARPPVVGLEFEMDCRGVFTEHVLPG